MKYALALLLIAFALPVLAQDTDEKEAVQRAALDYIEGFYEGDDEKIKRGVHPEVDKYGFYVARDASAYTGSAMSL